MLKKNTKFLLRQNERKEKKKKKSEECKHKNEKIKNAENELICIECGLVIEKLLISNEDIFEGRKKTVHEVMMDIEKSNFYNDDVKEIYFYLYDLCNSFHLPPCLISKVVTLFRKFKQKFEMANISLYGPKNKHLLLALCFYRTCITENCQRTPEEIIRYFEISKKKFYDFEQKLEELEKVNEFFISNSEYNIDFDSILIKFASELHFNFRDINLMLKNFITEKNNFNSTNINVALCLIKYCKINRLKCPSFKTICDVCCVKENTLRDKVKKIRK